MRGQQQHNQRPRSFRAKRRREQRVSIAVKKAARRQKAQERFTEPLTGKQARKIAQAQAKLEFGPTERQIKSEVRGSAKREADLGQWYGQLAGDYAAGADRAQQAFTTAEQATNARLGEESARTQDTLKGLASADQSFAKLVGGPTNAGGLSQAAEAAAAAERQRATLAQPLTEMRANNVASYGARTTSSRLKGIEARQEERERRRKQQQDLQALLRERGSATVKGIQGLREGDREYKTAQTVTGAKEGYNHALEKQSKLGYKSTQLTAAATVAAANAAARARERGASAQEVVAAEQKAAAKVSGQAQENTARIQGNNKKKNPGGYTVAEGESLVKQAGVSFASPGEAVDYLVSRGVKRGVAKKSVHGVYQSAKRQAGK